MEYLHLGPTVEFGFGQIGRAVLTDAPRFAACDGSTGLAINPATFLIYDATDEITLPLSQHRLSVSLRNGLKEASAGQVRHLLGHYDICVFD